jgi:transcriptional regulator with XRE-family HTH domain
MLRMSLIDQPRRGRPPKPTGHPVGAHMRQRREALGWTVREFALRVGLRESSASYLSQIESGAKTPHPALALRLAEALKDDPRIYLAWAATGKRSGPIETARAVRTLAETLGHPSYVGLTATEVAEPRPPRQEPTGSSTSPTVPLERSDVLEQARLIPDAEESFREALPHRLPDVSPAALSAGIPQAKILVPEVEEGADPGEASRSSQEPRRIHRVAADSLAGIEPAVRPFAFRLSAAGARRVSDVVAAGDLALVSRRIWPLERFALYAVRLSGHLLLSRVLWNTRHLLLLPGPRESDFIVLDAPDRKVLERLVAGKVVARILDHREGHEIS